MLFQLRYKQATGQISLGFSKLTFKNLLDFVKMHSKAGVGQKENLIPR